MIWVCFCWEDCYVVISGKECVFNDNLYTGFDVFQNCINGIVSMTDRDTTQYFLSPTLSCWKWISKNSNKRWKCVTNLHVKNDNIVSSTKYIWFSFGTLFNLAVKKNQSKGTRSNKQAIAKLRTAALMSAAKQGKKLPAPSRRQLARATKQGQKKVVKGICLSSKPPYSM